MIYNIRYEDTEQFVFCVSKGAFMQEITLKEIYNTLAPKLKVLLIILLIGAVIGGCVGAARTFTSMTYGTTIEFYVNPKRSDDGGNNQSQFGVYGAYGWHVMDNMTKLLASESFAEEMLLDDDGLPIEIVLKKEPNKTEIDRLIAEARVPIEAAKEAELSAEEITEIVNEKKLAYTTASSAANKANNKYLSLVSAKAPEEEISEAKAEAEEALATEKQAKLDFDAAEQEKVVAEQEVKQKKDDAQKKIKAVLDCWRQSEVYVTFIKLIGASVSYSFYNDRDMQTSNTEALAKSFIYVTISTPSSENVAKFIYERINEVLPRFVEDNMAVPSGYVGTNCQRITRLDEIKQTGSYELLSETIKYAVLLGFIALVLSMVFVVLVDRFKKWRAINKSAQGEELNTSDVSLGDGAVRQTSESNEKEENAPEWK